MPAYLPLHIRSQRDGNVVITPVDFPELALDGESLDATRGAVVERVARKLRRLSVARRGPLTDRRGGGLERGEGGGGVGGREGGQPPQPPTGLGVIGREGSGPGA